MRKTGLIRRLKPLRASRPRREATPAELGGRATAAKMLAENRARDEQLFSLRAIRDERGKHVHTLEALGANWNLTKERVRQIVKRMGRLNRESAA